MEVARPFEKKKKHSRNESESNLATKTLIHSAISIDEHRDGTIDSPKIKAARVKYLMEVGFLFPSCSYLSRRPKFAIVNFNLSLLYNIVMMRCSMTWLHYC